MKTIDFRHFKMFTDITCEQTREVDLHKDFADMLYKNMNGVMAHDVAMRIYKSEGPMQVNDEEEALLLNFAENGTPIFMDSLKANLHE